MIEIPACPICGSTAGVTHTVKDGVVTFRCAFTHGGVGPHVWDAPLKKPTARSASLVKMSSGWAATGGVTADLVVPLLNIVMSLPRVWIEHGVLEYELRVRHPDLFGRHAAERGHVLIKPKRNTASGARFAMALQRLHAADLLSSVWEPSTGGAWAHDSFVCYWATQPAPASTERLTWLDYAVNHLGRADGDWTEQDRIDVRQLAIKFAPPAKKLTRV